VTDGVAYGRITERIDEFNNRTDYDHRAIVFKRYTTYFYNMNNPQDGTIQILDNMGSVTGTSTNFTALNVGDVIKIDGGFNYEIVAISGDTEMYVTGLSINIGNNLTYYLTNTQSDNDGSGLLKSYDFIHNNIVDTETRELPTFRFQWELDNYGEVTSINNYIGNHSNFSNTNLSHSYFLLANNTFSLYSYSNTLGDRCYNNSSYTWFCRNKISGGFYNNSMWRGFYSNIVGEYCNNNLFGSYTWRNKLGEGFEYNKTFNDFQNNIVNNGFNENTIVDDFYKNDIGNGFNNNLIFSYFYGNEIGNAYNDNQVYSTFYDNQIGEYFENNTIGDIENLDNLEFYRNRIGNDFNSNNIRQDFQNNQIGNQFEGNTANGDFYKNVIGNGFNDNQNIGYNFYGNHIGNGFNNNDLIGDDFHNNYIGERFSQNTISYDFNANQIGYQFQYNTLGDAQYFNWNNTNISNLTGRTYNSFYNSLNEGIGNYILGKELIMHFYRNSGSTLNNVNLNIGEKYEITTYIGGGDFSNIADVISGTINTVGCVFIATGTTPTNWCGTTVTELTVYDEYHKVKFTQWTQGNNGGGFSYDRQKVYPSYDNVVKFTKTNYSDVVDVIIPGLLEIRRNNNGGIFNAVEEGSWNDSVSPYGTEWNSIYTQYYSGSGFKYNVIGNEFKGNIIRLQFETNNVSSFVAGNEFSGYTYSNDIGVYTYGNDFLGTATGNKWGGDFYLNIIDAEFLGNTIDYEMHNNVIGFNFQGNQIGTYFNNNTIGDNFGYGNSEPQTNKIGNNFHNNVIGEYFYNNNIPDNFYYNKIGDYFQWNIINTKVNYVNFTTNLGNITGFTYATIGSTASDDLYINVSGSTDGNGVNANFWVNVSGGAVVGISGLTPGSLYLNGDVITILGSSISGNVPNYNITITVTGISETPIAYEVCTKQIFGNKNNDKQISFYNENNVLTIEPIISNSVVVYSQVLSFPISNTSMNFECNASGLGEYTYGNQTVNNMADLVSLFNNWSETNKNGFYFDNGDGRLGVYISQALKNNLCPTGVITMDVFND
jgi:hypothetical protein